MGTHGQRGHWAYGPGKSQEEISGETRMEIPKPVRCISRDLTMQKVLHYCYNHQSYPVSKYPATRPKGGELFLYSLLPGSKYVFKLFYCVCTFVVFSKSTV